MKEEQKEKKEINKENTEKNKNIEKKVETKKEENNKAENKKEETNKEEIKTIKIKTIKKNERDNILITRGDIIGKNLNKKDWIEEIWLGDKVFYILSKDLMKNLLK